MKLNPIIKDFDSYDDAEKWVMSQIQDPLKETYRIRLMNSFGGVKLEHPKYLAMITERERNQLENNMESENNKEVEKLIESLQKQLIQQIIDTYEMLKNNYFKGHISEKLFFDIMDAEVDHLGTILKNLKEPNNEDESDD